MKLYYTPGACSLAPHIVLMEAGYDAETVKVDLKTKKTASGEDFNQINDKSAVPYLVLDTGEGLSENAVILQYLADQKPEAKLAPKLGTFERVRLNEMLNFITTELHKGFFPFFVELGGNAKDIYTKKLQKNFAYLAKKLEGKQYLTGDFSIADAYLYVMLTWAAKFHIDLSASPTLAEFKARMESRPKVQETREAEGLPKAEAA
jgi:glutathione S-transferase